MSHICWCKHSKEINDKEWQRKIRTIFVVLLSRNQSWISNYRLTLIPYFSRHLEHLEHRLRFDFTVLLQLSVICIITSLKFHWVQSSIQCMYIIIVLLISHSQIMASQKSQVQNIWPVQWNYCICMVVDLFSVITVNKWQWLFHTINLYHICWLLLYILWQQTMAVWYRLNLIHCDMSWKVVGRLVCYQVV